MTDIDRHGDEYPPSRPGKKTYIFGAVAILAWGIGMNWAAVSSLMHAAQMDIAQIESSLGL